MVRNKPTIRFVKAELTRSVRCVLNIVILNESQKLFVLASTVTF